VPDFGDYLNGDAVMACADLVGRAGANGFEMGYLHDDAPTVEEAGWYATAFYRGARVSADDHKSPTLAATALAERLLRGASCRCGRTVVLRDGADGCRWRLVGKRWEPGCDAEPVKIEGRRGDHAAMERAMNARRGGRRG
jgi:hypothetical protein